MQGFSSYLRFGFGDDHSSWATSSTSAPARSLAAHQLLQHGEQHVVQAGFVIEGGGAVVVAL
ncbi:MAG TPA: hypothetical protein VMY43_04690 [Methanothrix sp.]|nr:hypothetical protein [Methanothrix sp.]